MSLASSALRLLLLSGCLSCGIPVSASANDSDLPAGERVMLGRGPVDMVFSVDGRKAYVTENDDNTLAVIDVPGRRVLSRVGHETEAAADDSGCLDNFCRGMGAAGVVVDPEQQRAYVSSWRIDALTAFDLGSNVELWSTPVQRFPQTVLFTPDNTQLWVFNLVANSVSVLDAASGKPLGDPLQLEGGDAYYLPFGRPLAFAMARDGQRVFAGSAHDRSIEIFDVATRSSAGRIESGYSPHALAVDSGNGNLVALFNDGVLEYESSTLKPIRGYRFCRELTSWNLALSADGRLMALTLPHQNLVLVVKRDSGLLERAFASGEWPSRVAFVPDSQLLAVLNTCKTSSLSLFDLQAGADIEAMRSQVGELFCVPTQEELQWLH